MKTANQFRPVKPQRVAKPPPIDYERASEDTRANLIEALRDDGSDFGRQLLRELESER